MSKTKTACCFAPMIRGDADVVEATLAPSPPAWNGSNIPARSQTGGEGRGEGGKRNPLTPAPLPRHRFPVRTPIVNGGEGTKRPARPVATCTLVCFSVSIACLACSTSRLLSDDEVALKAGFAEADIT